MEGEERSKVGSKRRAKQIEVEFDSGDDEPIGSFLKLKIKRNVKKNKVGLDGGQKKGKGVEKLVVQNEDLVGMDDTLASFRKKLRAPKKDGGRVSVVGKDLSGDVTEPSDQPLGEPVEDGDSATKVSEKVQEDGGDRCNEISDKGEAVATRKGRRSKDSFAVKNVGPEFGSGDIGNHLRFDDNSSQHENELASGSEEGPIKCLDEGLEDSLSAFLRKTQSGLIRKSRSSLRLKSGKETQLSTDGPDEITNGVSMDPQCESSRRFQSASELANEIEESNEVLHSVSTRGMIDSTMILDKTDDFLPGKFSSGNSGEELSSAPLTDHETLKSCDMVPDTSPERVLEDSVPISTHQRSKSTLKVCTNSTMGVRDSGLIYQTSSLGPSENDSVKTACVLWNAQMPVPVADSEPLERQEILPVIVSSNDLNSGLDQKVSTSDCKEVLPFCPDCKLLNSQSNDKSLCSNRNVCGEILEPSASSVALIEKMRMAESLHHELDSDRSVQEFGHAEVHLLSGLDAPQKELSSNECSGPDQVPDNSNEEAEIASISSEKDDPPAIEGSLSPASAYEITKYEISIRVKHQDKSQRLGDETNLFSETVDLKYNSTFKQNKSFDSTSRDACHPVFDSLSGDEEAKGVSSPSDVPDYNESNAEDTGMLPDSENKSNRLSVGRVPRKPKRRRHGDMAYEGDADWEILTQEQDFLVSRQVGDGDRSSKAREKIIENGGAAAISAGLKARSIGPVEKIKFKDVLKRKGGNQEYLECRNFILSLWNKDVSRILPLSDCGVSDTPLVDESSHASLVRDIYAFLDQCGHINCGVASAKAENGAEHNIRLLKEESFVEKSGAPVAEATDGVSFIVGKVKKLDNSSLEKNDIALDDRKQVARGKLDERLINLQATELSTQTERVGFPADNNVEIGGCDAKVLGETVSLDNMGLDPSSEDENGRVLPIGNPDMVPPDEAGVGLAVSAVHSKLPKGFSNTQAISFEERSDSRMFDLDGRKRIIVVGAGPAGLTAARHLQRQGFFVTVLEARSRIGGRVFTDRSSLSVPVDLGASIITGVEADVTTERRADPSSLVCAQLGLELTVLNSDCPLYDTVTREKVPADLDEALEAEYNSLLDDMLLLVAQKGEHAMRMSLEDGLEYALKRRRMVRSGRNLLNSELHESLDTVTGKVSVDEEVPEDQSCTTDILSPFERRVMDWHFANLEYGCAALLKEVSLPHWNQDDVYGGFGGAHCMIKGGYSTVVESLGEGLGIHLSHVVTEIKYCAKDGTSNDDHYKKVKVSTSNGKEFSGDAVLITVPLGCLKAQSIKFFPELPEWKYLSIQRLGFGVLNKVVMEFADVFWDDSIDYFGATAEETNQRGWCFMFWNVKKTVGAPVLIALVVGKAAIDGQNLSSSDHVNHALVVLRKLFGETAVPDPVASVVTDWGKDPYSYGAYSYVAVGSTGEDYDLLGRPVENCLFFAGEATCKEHPDTVGGAMMSGLREAVRIIDILTTGTDYTAEVEALEAAKSLDVEKSEIREIIKRLDAVQLSDVLFKNSLDQTQILTRESLLQDMFYSTKTTAGRLHVAKELLKLPAEVLKSFAGTREGLSMLNSWMLDSLGKDGTQLLRHCVRLLVLVSTDLLAVRLSGIGKTVKEKVCVHTSRDIRAIASQLVSVWIGIFRKEKASNGGLKLQRQQTSVDALKSKSVQAPGRQPLRTNHVVADNKGSIKVSSSKSHLPSSTNFKKTNFVKSVKSEVRTDSKSDVKPSSSQGSVGRQNATWEESKEFPMTEEEKVAFDAAEAARAAALAAAEAYASSGTKCGTSLPLPKIPSFNKFARREQYARIDEHDVRKNWSAGAFGKQDCLSEIDSRNCRVRDWSVDFSAAGVNLDTSKTSFDNHSQRSQSNEVPSQLNFREHSGENVTVDSSLFTKAWVESAGSEGIKDYNAIDRWQCQAAAANSDFFQTMHLRDEEDSNVSSKLPTWKHEVRANESSASRITVNKELVGNQPRGAEHIKQAVVDYVASLLMPLYKARKIDREGYKSIMKKTATKVMEQATDAEKAMAVLEFLDFKRKNKIRAFVDKLIERHMAMKPSAKL